MFTLLLRIIKCRRSIVTNKDETFPGKEFGDFHLCFEIQILEQCRYLQEILRT